MAKIGRNQPCPCGSGKKYKQCCLQTDNAARTQALQQTREHQPSDALAPPGYHFAEEELDRLSNSVVDLIQEGRLDEAESACQALKAQYPDVIDWLMRFAMLHEARGEIALAIDYCERTLAWMDDHPDDFEPASREPFHQDIERLRRLLVPE